MSKVSYPSVIANKKSITANIINRTPKVFTIVIVPHSQKQSRSVSVSMKTVYTVCAIILSAAVVITGYNAYKNHLNRKNLSTAVSESSSLEQEKNQLSALSEELLLNVSQLSEETISSPRETTP
jgi:hypothetical protein